MGHTFLGRCGNKTLIIIAYLIIPVCMYLGVIVLSHSLALDSSLNRLACMHALYRCCYTSSNILYSNA